MKTTFDYRDVLSLAVAVRGKVLQIYPNIEFYPTCNPGNPKAGAADEHYIAFCERVYDTSPQNPGSIGRFVGYVTYRMNEVKTKSKLTHLPVLSSVEVRKDDFSTFVDGKVHFDPIKVNNDHPAIYSNALIEAQNNPSGKGLPYDMAQCVGKQMIDVIVGKVIQMIDGTLN